MTKGLNRLFRFYKIIEIQDVRAKRSHEFEQTWQKRRANEEISEEFGTIALNPDPSDDEFYGFESD